MSRARMTLFLAVLVFIPHSAFDTPHSEAAEALQEIVVKPGDTLWGIANYYLKDPKKWPELLKHNPQLTSSPTVALPGMRLRIPVFLIKEQLRAAELVYLLKEVRYRRKQTAEWKEAKLNMELYNEDGLRTMSESTARIRFPTGEIVNLNENSLILIRPEKGQDAVELMAGEVNARQSRVITAGGAKVDPLGADADYRTRIRQDKTELVLVYRGRVDVTAQGRTVRVPEGFGSEIRPLMPPTEPMPLPKIPLVSGQGVPSLAEGDPQVRALAGENGVLLSVEIPELRDVHVERDGAATREAAGRERAGAKSVPRRQLLDKYRVQVDDGEDFKDPVADRTAPLSEKLNLLGLGLPNGSYFWRIAFVDSLGMEGPFSAAQAFVVDLEPPPLALASPHDGMETPWEEEFLRVLGQTEPGCAVRVDDKSVEVDAEGRFATRFYVREGKNRLKVVTRDPSGNENSLERVVYRLAAGQSGKSVSARKEPKKRTKEAPEEREGARDSPLAAFGVGLLTISTIVGIILLIVG